MGRFVDPGLIEHNEMERDTTLPTAPCASCESIEVFQIQDPAAVGFGNENPLVCLTCGSLLTLKLISG